MKLGILSITALLVTIGLATPVRADVECRGSRADRICLDETNRDSDRRGDDYAEINQIYREVLGRNADREGLRTYSRKLDEGESLSDIRADIAEGDEVRDAVDRIYEQLVGESADRSNLNEYVRRLGRGWTLSDVRADIVNSDDFRSRYRGRNSDDFRRRYPSRRPRFDPAPRYEAPSRRPRFDPAPRYDQAPSRRPRVEPAPRYEAPSRRPRVEPAPRYDQAPSRRPMVDPAPPGRPY